MSDWHTVWTNYANQFGYPADDVARGMIFRDGYDAGHASAEAKYAPALSAAQAERDLARQQPTNVPVGLLDSLSVRALRTAHGRFLNTRDVHELARAVGRILNGPDDVLPSSEWKTVERPGDADG